MTPLTKETGHDCQPISPMKLFVPPTSRYQHWKFQVSPGWTATGGLTGMLVRSSCNEKLGPWPTLALQRPMLPPRHR